MTSTDRPSPLDQRLAAFFAARAEMAAATAPDIDEAIMALEARVRRRRSPAAWLRHVVAAEFVQRSYPSRIWVWLVIALLTLMGLVVGALVVGTRPRAIVVPTTSATAVASPSPSPRQLTPAELQPMPSGDTTCPAGLIHVVAGGTTPRGATAPPVRPGERIAYVALGKTDPGGSAVDAQLLVAATGSVMSVATMSSATPFKAGARSGSVEEVEVDGWSENGATLLVWAGRWSPSAWYHECADLYLVRTDGSSALRLTDNGAPGSTVGARALAPDGGSVAYVEVDESTGAATLRIWEASGRTTVVDTTGCTDGLPSFGAAGLAWSPDGRYLVATCESPGVVASRAVVYRATDRTSRLMDLIADAGVSGLVWTPDSARVVASVHGAALEVVALDPSSGSVTVLRDMRGQSALSELGFSSDASRLLVAGCPDTPDNPACFATELDVLDIGSGALRPIYSGPGTDATNSTIESAQWLPDGRVSMVGGSGGIVIDTTTGRPTKMAWPIDAVMWLPAN